MDLNKSGMGFDQNDVQANKVAAVLSYLGVLVVVTLLIAPDSKFARYHANQGLTLLIAEVIYGIVRGIVAVVVGWIPFVGSITVALISLLGIAFFILSILGMVNAAQGEAKPLPVIGGYQILK